MTDELSDEQLRRLEALLEHEGLQAFLPYAKQAAAEAKLTAARKLIWQSYRQMFIAAVALIVAVATFWEKLGAFVRFIAEAGK
jgi:hypothetical protein